MTKYNHEKIYREKISPLIKEINNICLDNQIPMFMAFATENSIEDTTYNCEMLSADDLDLELNSDKFADFVNVKNGFTTIYPCDDSEMEITY